VPHPEPHPPQLCGSFVSLTQVPPQHERPFVHALFMQGPPDPSVTVTSWLETSCVEPSLVVLVSLPPSAAPPSMLVVLPLQAKRKTESDVRRYGLMKES
jgi:hypothetical protein